MLDMDLVAIIIGVITLSIGVPLVRAVSRNIERRGLRGEDSGEIRDRLQAIEQAVDAIAVEVERISEAQRFTTRLLADRTPGDAHEAGGTPAPRIHQSGVQ